MNPNLSSEASEPLAPDVIGKKGQTDTSPKARRQKRPKASKDILLYGSSSGDSSSIPAPRPPSFCTSFLEDRSGEAYNPKTHSIEGRSPAEHPDIKDTGSLASSEGSADKEWNSTGSPAHIVLSLEGNADKEWTSTGSPTHIGLKRQVDQLKMDGGAMHRTVPMDRWCVTKSDMHLLRGQLVDALMAGVIVPTALDQFNPEDREIGPSVYTVVDQFIKPLTLSAGGQLGGRPPKPL